MVRFGFLYFILGNMFANFCVVCQFAASASVDAKLEAEDDDVAEEIPRFISNNVYHAKKALRWVQIDC